MKRLNTHQENQPHWWLSANGFRGKQQIHTIRNKCYHEGKSAAINKERAKKWRFKAVIHAQEGLFQIPPKMALRKGRFPKSRKNARFLLFTAPNLRYFPLGGQLYTKAPTTA